MKVNSRTLVIIISAIIVMASISQGGIIGPLSLIGYTWGGEGVSASFTGIEWNSGGSGDRSDLLPSTYFTFDPDDPYHYAPNIEAEMTNAFLPEGGYPPSYVPPAWWSPTKYINNPIDIDTWNLPDPSNPLNTTIAYEVQEYILKMYVSVTASWDSEFEGRNKRYTDTKLWIQLDINRGNWIFEGQPQTYFAVGKVVCSDRAWGKLGESEDPYVPTPWISVAPESPTTYAYVYLSKYGDQEYMPIDPFTYQGRQLNPDLFAESVWIHLDLNNFGTETWKEIIPPATHFKGDAVTWGFDVHVFVVGEWKVQDIEKLPDSYGRTPKTTKTPSWFELLMGDPRLPLWSFIGLGALVVLFLAVFAPWVLMGIVGLSKQASSKRG